MAVTVLASLGWQAEAFTKAAFLAGPAEAVALLEDHGINGVMIADDGEARWTAGLRGARR